MPNSSNCECILVIALAVILLVWVAKPLMYPTPGVAVEGMMPKILDGNDSNNSNYTTMPMARKYPPNTGSVPDFNNCRRELGDYQDRSEPSLVDGPYYGKSGVGFPYSENNDMPGYVPGNFYFLSSGDQETIGVGDICSPSCCATQYPTPFDVEKNPYIEANKDKFVKTQLYCNNSTQSSGCACITPKQAKIISNRGYSQNM